MPTQTLISQVLFDFGRALGLDGLMLDDDDHCCLKFDELEVHIQATQENAQVMLYSTLAVTSEPTPAVMRRLLAANYGMLGTMGNTVGVHPETGEVLLSRRFSSIGLEVLDFEALLQGFLETADTVQTFWASAQDTPTSVEPDLQVPMHTMIRA
ncbi:type III secretion system chaperone [Diaphorobacter caeni]|uniref:type III secretion system chaperone n=1 Tax=Diaphorobacter caeni TaxID=2784387 RepID=UPI00188FD575|nr:type III secretion system chaperone [Diaphorobacter caeni]MBF5007507.1 type III secretion system chaperone [Diaphorobacter caeni]